MDRDIQAQPSCSQKEVDLLSSLLCAGIVAVHCPCSAALFLQVTSIVAARAAAGGWAQRADLVITDGPCLCDGGDRGAQLSRPTSPAPHLSRGLRRKTPHLEASSFTDQTPRTDIFQCRPKPDLKDSDASSQRPQEPGLLLLTTFSHPKWRLRKRIYAKG